MNHEHSGVSSMRDRLTGVVEYEPFALQVAAHLRTMTTPAALFRLNLVRFSKVTEIHGRAASDALLVTIARQLDRHKRAGDILARTRDSEFAMFLLSCHEEQALQIARRMARAAHEVLRTIAGVSVAVCVGVVSVHSSTSFDSVWSEASIALVQANQGSGGIHIGNSASHAASCQRISLESDFPQALARNDLAVYYQPICSPDGTVTGVEALLRWKHQTWGMVSPEEILAMAAECGHLSLLDHWVINTALRHVAALRAVGSHLNLALNVSAQTVSEGSLPVLLTDTCQMLGLPPATVTVELTEHSMLSQSPETQQTLSTLRATGFHLALDDFGCGYASLANLRHLPVDMVKVDRMFVANLGHKGVRCRTYCE